MAAKRYPNRSDLRNPAQKVARQTAPGQTYGAGAEQMRAQQAVPMGGPPTSAAPQPMQNPETGLAPGSLGDMLRPSERPDEPITSGLPIGEGPGPESLIQPIPEDFTEGSNQMLIDQVRFVYSKYPNPAVFQLLLELENQPFL
jgi:hypothetical protein